MGSDLKGRKIKRGNMSMTKLAMAFAPSTAISKNAIVTASGNNGKYLTMTNADADNPAHALSPLWLSTSSAVVSPTTHLAVNGTCVSRGAIIGDSANVVDTSTATLGAPVYLSNTAGGWALSAGTHKRQIGIVAKVHATDGIIVFDGALGQGSISGRATIIAAAATVSIAFAAALVGSPVTATVVGTVADETVADATLTNVLRAHWSGNNLVITGNANATVDTLVAWILHR